MSYLYEPKMYAAERELAEYLKRFNRTSCQRIEPHYGSLGDIQPQAVDQACTRSMSLLSGCPGTGKTTTLGQVIQSFDRAKMRGVIMCPTGQAQKRASQVMEELHAIYAFENKPRCMTTHRGLAYSPQLQRFQHDHENTIDEDYVVIDEAPMTDCMVSRSLLAAIDPRRTRVVMSGDPNQLPPVDPGAVFSDTQKTGLFPSTHLTKIFRQGANSGIVWNAKQVLEGQNLLGQDPVTQEPFSDFFFVPKPVEETPETILRYVCEGIPRKTGFDPVKDIQVLAPGKKGEAGVENLNKLLRNRLNPDRSLGCFRHFRVGDKVINKKNHLPLNIVNGDVGYVIATSASGMAIDFGPGSGKSGEGFVEIEGALADWVHHAYCSTVHSFQGCEVKAVVMPLHMTHYMLLFRNLLYTGMTRAKQLAVLMGDPRALSRCIRNNMVDNRVTGLQHWLKAA